MAVGAPEPAVDPNLRELESIGVGPPPALERGATAAEDGNPFFFFALDDDDCGSGKPVTLTRLLRYQLDEMVSVRILSHSFELVRARSLRAGGRESPGAEAKY